jgi:UDP-N-acetylglucosamine 2-epimerase (non-hydrolysing)
MGTVYAKFLRLPSAHVEAGLRSGNWRHPFPEELDRRIAGHLASIHYVPSLDAVENLSKKSNVIFTFGNTVIDAVLDVESSKHSESEKYGVCLLHRFEFLGNEPLVRQTLSTIAEFSTIPIRVYLDDYSGSMMAEALKELDSDHLLPQRKLPYSEFIQTLQHADFVLTDSGGIQAECALLGLPTLIHRKATEQHEGVGENLLLSMWNMATVEDFLSNYESYKRNKQVPTISPSQVIFDDLQSRGYLAGEA